MCYVRDVEYGGVVVSLAVRVSNQVQEWMTPQHLAACITYPLTPANITMATIYSLSALATWWCLYTTENQVAISWKVTTDKIVYILGLYTHTNQVTMTTSGQI